MAYLLVGLIALLTNIPLGYLRAQIPKFSLKWTLWSYLSLPLMIYIILQFPLSKWFILPVLFLASYGQKIGAKMRRNKITVEEEERMEQIPDLKLSQNPAKIPDSKIMIVLLNMGGPKTNADVRPFLKKLFCDELIIKFPLQPLFAELLVRFRGKKTERRYQSIGGGSPIYPSTEKQTSELNKELKMRNRQLDTVYCFNYSPPFPEEIVQKIKAAGKEYILPLSLYPHYSRATSGSNLHYLNKAKEQIFPDLKFLTTKPYYLADSYIDALAGKIKETLKSGESLDDFYILFSAHGLPLYFLNQGDPYPFEIAQTVGKILDRLKRTEAWSISYQSAVGPMQWLKPSTEAALKALARRGVKKLIVVPVSFVTDHIETLCEIDIEYREFAKEVGIEDFRMSKALEDHPGFIKALADCVEASLN